MRKKMKDPITKNECVGLADLFAAAYYGWCRLQHIDPDESVADVVTDFGADTEEQERRNQESEGRTSAAPAPDLYSSVSELLQNIGFENMSDDELRVEEKLGNGLAPIILRARKVLRKAGKLPR
jgi:hypothetical protein